MRNRLFLALAFILTAGLSAGAGAFVALSWDAWHDTPRPPLEMQAPRSGQWPAVRKAHLQREPGCAICNSREGVEVHHCEPFHLRPELELLESNLISLCRKHHFTFGHLERWDSYNRDVRRDAAVWRKKLEERP